MSKILAGYPAVPGAKRFSIYDLTGPASYTAVTAGATVTGGVTVTARQFGLSKIEFVAVMGAGGLYDAVVYPVSVAAGLSMTSFILQFLTANGGAEVAGATNLSGQTIRLMAWGW